jgi:uncharacterized membrane protein (UPF0127 family)
MRYRKTVISVFFTLAVAVAAVYVDRERSEPSKDGVRRVTVDCHGFRVETVETEEDRMKGLGGREGLCPDCGMLFLFDRPERYGFWMKDMRFPLDIVWIDGDKVVFVARDVPTEPLESIAPPVPADKVLEIPAGSAERYGIRPGSPVEMEE